MADPGRPCRACGERPEVRYYPDGSYASTFHRCVKAPPGPRDTPQRFERGRHFPADPHEREVGALKGRILELEGQLVQTRRAVLDALRVPIEQAQDLARKGVRDG